MSTVAPPLPAYVERWPMVNPRHLCAVTDSNETRPVESSMTLAFRRQEDLAQEFLFDDDQEEDWTYNHVPFEYAGTIRVRYRMAGELPPRRVPFPEDVE